MAHVVKTPLGAPTSLIRVPVQVLMALAPIQLLLKAATDGPHYSCGLSRWSSGLLYGPAPTYTVVGI